MNEMQEEHMSGPRISLNEHYAGLAREAEAAMLVGIKTSRWFRTAPAEFRAVAVITILGVEQRRCVGLLGAEALRPALVAICECGGERQAFSMLIDTEVPDVRPVG
jgi:hypothetical protein